MSKLMLIETNQTTMSEAKIMVLLCDAILNLNI